MLSRTVPYAEIYTLGTGQWGSLTLGHVTYYINGRNATFLNNHFHWNIRHYEDPIEKFLAFDIDNETFKLFPSPPVNLEEDSHFDRMLGVLKGCLCFSYYARTHCEVLIWVMKEYGIKNSWQKEVLITESICPNISRSFVFTPKGSLNDGSILLMVYDTGQLLVYHPHTCTTRDTVFSHVDAISYRPTFLKLQNFESESVHKFPR